MQSPRAFSLPRTHTAGAVQDGMLRAIGRKVAIIAATIVLTAFIFAFATEFFRAVSRTKQDLQVP